MTAAEAARAARAGVGLFEPRERALVEVAGSDRARWLQGQVTNDVEALGPGEGCYAAALTVKGRIVADLHVLSRDDRFWLATGAAFRDALWQRLDRYIVADDVELVDASDRFAWLGLEGPALAGLLSSAGLPPRPEPECARDATLAGEPVVLWAFGASNLPACQVLAPAGAAPAVRAALLAAGEPHGLVAAGDDALEILRVESGVPGLGPELDEEVFPAEARLERALSTTKGCYTGQEIVERIRSRGNVNYLLVGLRFEEAALPAPGAELRSAEGKRVGEVTSVARSAAAGAIGLGYLRREHEAPGTELRTDRGTARVARLPFVPADASG